MQFCTACGAEVTGRSFCTSCGAAVQREPASAAPVFVETAPSGLAETAPSAARIGAPLAPLHPPVAVVPSLPPPLPPLPASRAALGTGFRAGLIGALVMALVVAVGAATFMLTRHADRAAYVRSAAVPATSLAPSVPAAASPAAVTVSSPAAATTSALAAAGSTSAAPVAVTCWDGSSAAAGAGCPVPAGAAGLRALSPTFSAALDGGSCVRAPDRHTAGGYKCYIEVPGRGSVKFHFAWYRSAAVEDAWFAAHYPGGCSAAGQLLRCGMDADLDRVGERLADTDVTYEVTVSKSDGGVQALHAIDFHDLASLLTGH